MGLNVKLDLNHWSFKKKEKKNHEFYIEDVVFELKMKSWVIQDPLHVLQSILFPNWWCLLKVGQYCQITAILWLLFYGAFPFNPDLEFLWCITVIVIHGQQV